MQAYGWGDTKFLSRNGSNVLLETSLTVVSPEVCQKMWLPHCKRMAMYGDEDEDDEDDEDEDEDEDDYRECLNNYLTDGMLCAGSPGKTRKSVCNVSTLVEKSTSFLHSIITKREFLIIMSIPIHKCNPG